MAMTYLPLNTTQIINNSLVMLKSNGTATATGESTS